MSGRRPVLELLRSSGGRVERVFLLRGGRGDAFEEVRALAQRQGVRIQEADRSELDRLAGGNHQGVLAIARERSPYTLEQLLEVVEGSAGAPLLVALDEPQDPGNVGAVVRTAEAAGAAGVVTTRHRSAAVGAGANRASAGALEYLPLVTVVNLRAALGRMKDAGLWVIGADAEAELEYSRCDLVRPCALVLGGEGRGLRHLTRRTCDVLVRIPMRGRVASLNMAAAAAILCFEALRQREAARGGPGR